MAVFWWLSSALRCPTEYNCRGSDAAKEDQATPDTGVRRSHHLTQTLAACILGLLGYPQLPKASSHSRPSIVLADGRG